MFIGHFAAGYAAKKFAPKVSLGVAFMAGQLLDLIWPVLVLLGIEKVAVDHSATVVTPFDFQYYPFSHSLLMTTFYACVFGGVVAYLLKSKMSGIVMGLVVLSHWFFDFLTHRPDMPILLEGAKVGLGLWNSLPLTAIVELLLFAGGITLYLKSSPPKSRTKTIGFWALVAFLLVVYAGNLLGSKPPEGTSSVAIAGPALAMWLIVAWGYWVDRE
jgi:hypothetical protein